PRVRSRVVALVSSIVDEEMEEQKPVGSSAGS
ncbi:XRE family transcriptional regulator, partial [Rhizobium hidalgonense]